MILLVAAILAASPPTRQEHVALVVGSNVSRADDVALRYAVLDARRVAELLVDVVGADVDLVEGPSAADFDHAVERTLHRLEVARGRGSYTLLTVYVAGHADAQAFHLADGAYPVDLLESRLRSGHPDLLLIVTDACRGLEDARERGLERAEGPSVELVLPARPAGAVRVAATSRGEAAQESDRLGGGVFTHFWLAALRGAADVNGDGGVTLAEAYAYASSQTRGHTATMAGKAQHPAYEMDLSGADELVLTRTGNAPSTLTLPAAEDTLYVVRRWPIGLELVEAPARAGGAIRLALPAGHFEVVRRGADRVASATVHLPWGGAAELAPGDFVPAVAEVHRRRGPDGEAPWAAALWLTAGPSLGVATVKPWQDVHLGASLTPPGAYEGWIVWAQVSWRRESVRLITADAMAEADAVGVDLGLGRTLMAGPVELTIGTDLLLEGVNQRELRRPASRFEAAGLRSSARRAVRGGLALAGGAAVPLLGPWAWTVRVVAGGVVEPRREGGARLVERLELATGPSVSW